MIEYDYDIVNRALTKLGANPITELEWLGTDKSKNALVMNRIYDDSLRLVLGETYWMFATKRVELALTEDAGNDVKWTKNNLIYLYDLPTDFIRLVGWSEPHTFVRQEGDYLVSDSYGGATTISINEAIITDWSDASVSYTVQAIRMNDDYAYYCTVAHTSSSSNEPGVGAEWEDYWKVMREVKTGVWTLVIDKLLGILYQYYNTTIATYPTYFIEAFVDRLVLDSSYMLAQNNTKTEYLEARYKATLSDAMAKNSQGQSPTSAKADAWLDAKYAGHNSWDNTGLNYR